MTDTNPPVNPNEGSTPEPPSTPPAAPQAPETPDSPAAPTPQPAAPETQTAVAPPAPPAPPAGQPGAPLQQQPVAPMNTLAIIAFIAAFFVSIAGIIMGHIALGQIKRSGERGRGLALAGTILGYVFLAGTIIAVISSLIFAAMFASAASQLSQASDDLQSQVEEPSDSTTEESAPATGDRSAEFCDALMGVDQMGSATNDDGSPSDEAIQAFEEIAGASSPNQAVYQRYLAVMKDPSKLANDEDPESLVSDFIDAYSEDAVACTQ